MGRKRTLNLAHSRGTGVRGRGRARLEPRLPKPLRTARPHRAGGGQEGTVAVPLGCTVRWATALWEPMMLTAWHSYWPWSWSATPEILSVPEERTRCLLSTDSWLPERHGTRRWWEGPETGC